MNPLNKNIPLNKEHHEALQAEVDKKRKEWLETQPDIVKQSIVLLERLLVRSKYLRL